MADRAASRRLLLVLLLIRTLRCRWTRLFLMAKRREKVFAVQARDVRRCLHDDVLVGIVVETIANDFFPDLNTGDMVMSSECRIGA